MIISVVGGRPNFMKLASVCSSIPENLNHVILHTGQHYDYSLSKSFFREFNIPLPDDNLKVGSGSQAQQTAKVLLRCENYFLKRKPRLVIVYGDMNSSLGAAISAVKLKIPVAHVEAGIRSFDKSIPEELNRIMIDHISTLLFAPTSTGFENLIKEGIKNGLYLTGDTTYDLFVKFEKKIKKELFKKLKLKEKQYFFATIHRQSNTDNRNNLKKILGELTKLSLPVVMPLHPRTINMIDSFQLNRYLKNTNINVQKPLKFQESLSLQKFAKAILTDSGGIQKEAYFLKVPCITFRDTTEWPETTEFVWNQLWDFKPDSISKKMSTLKVPQKHPNFFGNGHAGKIIADVIIKYLN